jgi:hypothetical protein
MPVTFPTGVSVRTDRTVEVKRIDLDYFGEFED